ncbi:MAG: hypothetical protein EPN51_04020 [Mycobacterium sp.]|nr:MAG: hypothetical protein EPN51_04020 [Mycobacterium sp.]
MAPSCLTGWGARAVATGSMVATRCARLRRAGDRHGSDGGDPLAVLGRWGGPRQLGVVVPVR